MAHDIAPIPERVIRVELGDRSYNAVVGAALLASCGSRVRDELLRRGHRPPARAALVADDRLPAEIVRSVESSLAASGFSVTRTAIEASEPAKSVANAERLCADLARAKLERHEPVIALGGGIVGDLAGFAAAVYRRGVPVVQCPTTLLSMVDAAVGGKTGANLVVPGQGLLKNLVGAFHQPHLVLADVSTLDSLPDRHLRAGLAECIKHAMLAADVEAPGEHPDSLLDRTQALLPRVLSRNHEALAELVARNIAIKARVVASDERELSNAPSGGRAALNLGHTFAHAIETLPALSPDADPANAPLHHGEAVALGLRAAAACAAALKLIDPHVAERVSDLLAHAGLPTRIAGLPPGPELLARMAHDKKVASGRLRLVLPVAAGRVRIVEAPDPAAVTLAWDAIRA